MVNKKMLLSRMAAKGENQSTMAAKIGVSKNTFNAKINNKGCFDTQAITDICDILGITDSAEKADIFLGAPSQNRDEITETEV